MAKLVMTVDQVVSGGVTKNNVTMQVAGSIGEVIESADVAALMTAFNKAADAAFTANAKEPDQYKRCDYTVTV